MFGEYIQADRCFWFLWHFRFMHTTGTQRRSSSKCASAWYATRNRWTIAIDRCISIIYGNSATKTGCCIATNTATTLFHLLGSHISQRWWWIFLCVGNAAQHNIHRWDENRFFFLYEYFWLIEEHTHTQTQIQWNIAHKKASITMEWLPIRQQIEGK